MKKYLDWFKKNSKGKKYSMISVIFLIILIAKIFNSPEITVGSIGLSTTFPLDNNYLSLVLSLLIIFFVLFIIYDLICYIMFVHSQYDQELECKEENSKEFIKLQIHIKDLDNEILMHEKFIYDHELDGKYNNFKIRQKRNQKINNGRRDNDENNW